MVDISRRIWFIALSSKIEREQGARQIPAMLMDLVFALFFGFLAVEVFTLVQWRGAWRLAALLPLFIVGFIIIRIVVDPAQHYLLAFEVLVWSFLALVFLGLLAGIRWMMEFMHRRRIR